MRMRSVWNLSWWRSLLYKNQSIDLQNKLMDWFLYDKNLHHEIVNAFQLSCFHWDIFLDYNKIIDIYASKYQRRMLLISPLSKNLAVEMFNATKTHKAYTDFGIFSLYFIVVICKNFRFASTNYRCTNADLKICQYIRLHMKIICRRFHIKTPFTFWDMHTWDMQKVSLNTLRNKRIC